MQVLCVLAQLAEAQARTLRAALPARQESIWSLWIVRVLFKAYTACFQELHDALLLYPSAPLDPANITPHALCQQLSCCAHTPF
eukprot:scaffold31171_cov18-Tisochrysis_lutea.AAC.5